MKDIRPLVKPDHPLLRKELPPFDFNDPPVHPQDLSFILLDALEAYNGLGLAANQLGLPYRVFVMRGNPHIVCFNPKVVHESDEQVVLEEGCLTFPGLYVNIKRSRTIRVRYQDVNGKVITNKFTDITARCFLHELDHLNGVLYLNRASKININRAKRKMKLIERKRKKVPQPLLFSE